ncbi:hypothetical protein Rcae01_06485 [Novipirellula caenicola]|uniref:Uncharacterized protein n=1 Tax=Novipirellula caenicola TaxID=1536901 RepID=A0ABP9W0V1_9BACT
MCGKRSNGNIDVFTVCTDTSAGLDCQIVDGDVSGIGTGLVQNCTASDKRQCAVAKACLGLVDGTTQIDVARVNRLGRLGWIELSDLDDCRRHEVQLSVGQAQLSSGLGTQADCTGVSVGADDNVGRASVDGGQNREVILNQCDVTVRGRYPGRAVDSWRSGNRHVIDVAELKATACP